MKRVSKALMVLFLAVAVLLTGCSGNTDEKGNDIKDVKVGFIYVGPTGDGGWSYAHEMARQYVVEKLGVETLYKESVEEGPEVENVMKDMIDQGANVIFATSFGYMDYMEKVSKEYPEVKFMHCSGYKMTENMGNYFGRIYEPRYLSGMVAGMKTESDVIGYVAAFDIPEVVRGINAFTLGVQAVNPDAVVKVRWTNTWYDPAKEYEAARALLDEGADVIAQHQDTAGPQQAAQERGVWSIGYHTDMEEAAPDAYMTSPVWDFGPYYVEQIQAVIDGTWTPESYWGSMEDGVVALAPLSKNAPEGAQEAVDEAQAKIASGELKVFAGPIKDQAGNVKVAEGQVMTDDELLSFDWFVQGVEGKINK